MGEQSVLWLGSFAQLYFCIFRFGFDEFHFWGYLFTVCFSSGWLGTSLRYIRNNG